MSKVPTAHRRSIVWPDNKKLCVTFTVALEAFNKEGSFKRWPGLEVNLHSVSHANYGGNAGIWRLMEIMERQDVRSTILLNGLAAQRWPESVKTLHALGHELAGHGMTNEILMTSLSAEGQRNEVRQVSSIIESLVAWRPVGWQGPGGGLHTLDTLAILVSEGFMWSGDQCDDDVPYVVEVGGGRIAIIPKLWSYSDRNVWNNGATSGHIALESFKEGFDFALEEARRGRPGRVDATVHAEYTGRPYLAPRFEKIIEYVRSFEDEVWVATHAEMADHALKTQSVEKYRPFE
jgi:peptidoglycan/xylan/chitin deacetylase (PgdA/CDA1 family)